MKRCFTELHCANRGPHKVNSRCENLGHSFYKVRRPSKYEVASRLKSASVVSIMPWYVRLWNFIKQLFLNGVSDR